MPPPTPAERKRRRGLALGIAAAVLAGGVALALMVKDETDGVVTGEAAYETGPRPSGASGPASLGDKRAGTNDPTATNHEGTQPPEGAVGAPQVRAAVSPSGKGLPADGGQPGTPASQASSPASGAEGGVAGAAEADRGRAVAADKVTSRARKADGGVAAAPVGKADAHPTLASAQPGSIPGELGAASAGRDAGVPPTDGGVPPSSSKRGPPKAASAAEPGGARQTGGGASPGKAWVNERSRVDEEDSLTRLDRFVAGGSTLTGRVIAAETGKPVEGATIHAHSGGSYVEALSDASGAFRVAGMPAGSHAIIWVDRPGGSFIDERIEIAIGAEGKTSDAGTIRLLRGDELRAHAPGWVGLFVSRRGAQIVAGAVSAWLPADKADIQVGDEILAIDGHDTAGLGPRAATFLLRGAVGTPTTIVVRAQSGAKRTVKLERVPR